MHNTELKNHSNDSVAAGGDTIVTGTTTPTMTNGDIGGLTNGGARHGTAAVQINGATSSGTLNECAGCRKKIVDRYLLKALDMYWHEDCLKCGCCDCRLGEVGSTLYFKANLMLCKRDYLRLFGSTGYCAACSKVIPAFEMVMRARNNVYHLECFACQQCNHRFCVGDKFYLCENKILCEYDYEERMVFANMAYSPGNLAILRSQETKTSGNMNALMNNNSSTLSPKMQSLSPSPHHPPTPGQRTTTAT